MTDEEENQSGETSDSPLQYFFNLIDRSNELGGSKGFRAKVDAGDIGIGMLGGMNDDFGKPVYSYDVTDESGEFNPDDDRPNLYLISMNLTEEDLVPEITGNFTGVGADSSTVKVAGAFDMKATPSTGEMVIDKANEARYNAGIQKANKWIALICYLLGRHGYMDPNASLATLGLKLRIEEGINKDLEMDRLADRIALRKMKAEKDMEASDAETKKELAKQQKVLKEEREAEEKAAQSEPGSG